MEIYTHPTFYTNDSSTRLIFNSFLLLLLFRWTETAQAQRDQERANDIDEINYRNNQKLLAENRERDSRENRDSAPGKNKFNFIILFFIFVSLFSG